MSEADIDRSLVKLAVFGGLGLLSALLFGYYLQAFRLAPSGGVAIWAAVGLALWLAFALVTPYAVKSASIAGLLFGLQAIVVTLFLFGFRSPLAIPGSFLLMWLALMAAYLRGRSELGNALRVRFLKSSGAIAGALVLGLNLFLTLLLVSALRGEGARVPKPFLEAMARMGAPVFARYVPGFSPEMRVADFFTAFASRELPPGTPPEAVAEAAAGLEAELERRAGFAIDGSASVLEAAGALANAKLDEFFVKNRAAALFSIAALAFLTLMGFGFFVKWGILIVALLLYEVLYAARFFRTEFEAAEREVIVV